MFVGMLCMNVGISVNPKSKKRTSNIHKKVKSTNQGCQSHVTKIFTKISAEMGHVLILLHKMGLHKMRLDKMG